MAFLGHHMVTAASMPIDIRPLSKSKTALPMDIDSMERDDSTLTEEVESKQIAFVFLFVVFFFVQNLST